ncbi:hypothetical protein VB10N_43440 [Vibrio sp. 10N]|nr:hypothetical protein VB10N_43440 [Vibrio sp. 10N]
MFTYLHKAFGNIHIRTLDSHYFDGDLLCDRVESDLAAGAAMVSSRIGYIGVDVYKRRYSDISVVDELRVLKYASN